MAVCSAGEDVIGPYLADRKRHLVEVVKPLPEKPETVYIVVGSDAKAHAKKRFKNKWVKHVGSGCSLIPCAHSCSRFPWGSSHKRPRD